MPPVLRELRAEREQVWARYKQLLKEGVDGREAELDQLEARIGKLTDEIEASELQPAPPGGGALHGATDDGSVLLAPDQRLADRHTGGGGEVRLGALVAAMVTGNRSRLSDDERRALAEGADVSGGILVPTDLASEVIDRARAQSVAIRAGARTFEMTTQEVDLAKVLSDPDPAWRLENTAIGESEPTFGAVTLNAKSLATIVRMSREVAEDAEGLTDLVRDLLATSFALKIDLGILRGDGTGGAPTGIRNTSGVTVTSLAADGRAPTYNDVIDAMGRVEDENEAVSATVWAPRTGRTFAKLTASDGQPMRAPEVVAAVPQYATTQIPTNLTTGVNTDTSEIYVGDFAQAVLGIRTDLVITPLNERYADLGQVGLVAWFRGDVGIRRATAFEVITGVRP